MEIRSEWVTYNFGDTEMEGFVAWDASLDMPRPGIIIVHEWWGHNEYVQSRAKQLAEKGFVGFAIDMYGKKTADNPTEANDLMMSVLSDRHEEIGRFVAAHQLLKSRPECNAEKTAAIGYCFGGKVVLDAAREGIELDAVVSFHGSLGADVRAEKGRVQAKVRSFIGKEDPFIPQEDRDAFVSEMKAAEVDFEQVEYPGVKHGFTVQAATERGKKFDLPLQYDAEADRESFKAMLALFRSELA